MTLTEPRVRATRDGDTAGALTDATLDTLAATFAGDATARLMQNAVTQTTVDDLALNRAVVTTTDNTFSTLLDDWTVTAQKKSGRCWMFAGLNLLRVGAREKMGLKQFEFSQNYTLFWDKLERANYFLEAIIETADRDLDDRTVAFLLSGFSLMSDGGQWNMFVNLIQKHGLVPKSVMPESESSSNTQRMNSLLRAKLREGAMQLRERHAAGDSHEALRAAKDKLVAVIYRMLCIHLGTPPTRFTWQWTDRDGQFHRDEETTPQAFAAKYVTLPVDDYVCLVHDPRPTSPVGRTFTVEYLGNVVGGTRVKYLNVPIETMKGITQRTIENGEPVWFGCDVGKQMRRDLGLWDARLFDYNGVYGTEFGLNKAQRLAYGDTQMTHAMLFTGVDSVDGHVRRWRVENSWGEENGVKGFFTMNDSWYDEYMFEIAARAEMLPPDLRAALDEEPIILPAWDPMGALAR